MRIRNAALVLMALAACAPAGEPTSPPDGEVRERPDGAREELRPGTLAHYGDPVQVQVPAVAQRGQAFEVRVTTYGGGCVHKGRTDVRVDGLSARITPYDWEVVQLPQGSACTMELRLLQHTASVRFDQAGTGRVQIHGRSKPSGEAITVERTVQVQ